MKTIKSIFEIYYFKHSLILFFRYFFEIIVQKFIFIFIYNAKFTYIEICFKFH